MLAGHRLAGSDLCAGMDECAFHHRVGRVFHVHAFGAAVAQCRAEIQARLAEPLAGGDSDSDLDVSDLAPVPAIDRAKLAIDRAVASLKVSDPRVTQSPPPPMPGRPPSCRPLTRDRIKLVRELTARHAADVAGAGVEPAATSGTSSKLRQSCAERQVLLRARHAGAPRARRRDAHFMSSVNHMPRPSGSDRLLLLAGGQPCGDDDNSGRGGGAHGGSVSGSGTNASASTSTCTRTSAGSVRTTATTTTASSSLDAEELELRVCTLRGGSHRQRVKAREFEVLGSQTLVDLLDCPDWFCATDEHVRAGRPVRTYERRVCCTRARPHCSCAHSPVHAPPPVWDSSLLHFAEDRCSQLLFQPCSLAHDERPRAGSPCFLTHSTNNTDNRTCRSRSSSSETPSTSTTAWRTQSARSAPWQPSSRACCIVATSGSRLPALAGKVRRPGAAAALTTTTTSPCARMAYQCTKRLCSGTFRVLVGRDVVARRRCHHRCRRRRCRRRRRRRRCRRRLDGERALALAAAPTPAVAAPEAAIVAEHSRRATWWLESATSPSAACAVSPSRRLTFSSERSTSTSTRATASTRFASWTCAHTTAATTTTVAGPHRRPRQAAAAVAAVVAERAAARSLEWCFETSRRRGRAACARSWTSLRRGSRRARPSSSHLTTASQVRAPAQVGRESGCRGSGQRACVRREGAGSEREGGGRAEERSRGTIERARDQGRESAMLSPRLPVVVRAPCFISPQAISVGVGVV